MVTNKKVNQRFSCFPFLGKSKRAQGLQLNTLILIILGVLILVFLIWGFTAGWKNILPWIKPDNNLQQITTQCALACSTDNKYDFCTKVQDIVVDDETIKAKIADLPKKTCKTLSAITELGIDSCSTTIQCDKTCLEFNGALSPTACTATQTSELSATDISTTNPYCCVPKPAAG